jgi:hypothetical protein
MRYLNGFILIGIMLLLISIAGAATGNRLLTEPGQPANPYAWLEYLGAAVLMLVNGGVSIWKAREDAAHKSEASDKKEAAQAEPAAEKAN